MTQENDTTRILLLGGNHLMVSLVEECQAIGLEVYVTDNTKNSPAKEISDHVFDISIRDIDAVLEIISIYKINGVLCGFTDSVLPYYQEICQKAGLPCYISNDKQLTITTDKEKLKATLGQYDIPHLKSYLTTEVSYENYPLIVKPADNSGGRGIQVCHSPVNLSKALQLAKASSPSKRIIIEEKLEAKEATAFYYLAQGEIIFLGLGDRVIKNFYQDNIPLPVLYRFPSDDEQNFLFQLDNKIRALVNDLEMKNGLVYLQLFNHLGKFIVYELAYRLTGSLEYKIFEHIRGINAAKLLADFSVGNEIKATSLHTKSINKNGYNLTISCDNKKDINSIIGIEEIKTNPKVIYIHQNFSLTDNDSVAERGTLSQVAFRILFLADTEHEAIMLIATIKQQLCLLDLNGNSIPYYTI